MAEMTSLFDDEEDTDALEYGLGPSDRVIVDHAFLLLEKLLRAPFVTPAEISTLAKLLHVLKRMPRTSKEMVLRVDLAGPHRSIDSSGEAHVIGHYWAIEIEGDVVSVTSGGSFSRPSTGSDSFTSMQWRACPGEDPELSDYLPHILGIVDDAMPFNKEVELLDLSQPGFWIEVRDEENELLDEDGSDETREEE